LNTNIKNILEESGFHLNNEIGIWHPEKIEEFAYNDGDDAENYILNVLKEASDLSVDSDELTTKMIDWPSTYHLSPRRSNLLRPFENIFENKRILEIGCGCGAITRFLGEAGAHVVSVEGSFRRAQIARTRCRDLKNVEIICNPADKLPDLGKFDFVLLIGVLEYARVFVGPKGEETLLAECHERLDEDGKLFVAIENKLGIKYFAGAHEDHVNQPMFGINNSYTDTSVVTFGRNELKTLLNSQGFNHLEEYLPLPDYKLPTSVVTPLGWREHASDLCQLAVESIHKDPQLGFEHIFSAEQGMRNVWNNNLAADLANSFLMVAAKTPFDYGSENIAAIHYSDDRLSGLRKVTEFHHFNDDDLKVKVTNKTLEKGENEGQMAHFSEFFRGDSLWFELLHALNKPDWQISYISEWANKWLSKLLVKAGEVNEYTKDTVFPDSYQDALPFNIVTAPKGESKIFDLEWETDKPTLGYVVFRGIYHSLLRMTSVSHSEHCPTSNIADLTFIILNEMHLQVDRAHLDLYLQKEAKFLAKVQLSDEVKIYNDLKSLPLVIRAKKLININVFEAAQAEHEAEKEALNNNLEELKNTMKNLDDGQSENRELMNQIHQLNERLKELERVNKLILSENIQQQNKLNNYHSDIHNILNSVSWRITSPVRIISRHLPERIRVALRRFFTLGFKSLQIVKIKSVSVLRKVKRHADNNGSVNTAKKALRHIAKKTYQRIPAKYQLKALTIAMRIYPKAFRNHPHFNTMSTHAPVVGNTGENAFINYDAQKGYGFSAVPDEYVYIPPNKPFYFDETVSKLAVKPKISIVVPIYNTPAELFEFMLSSVSKQWYTNWELLLVNDASPQPEIKPLLHRAAQNDKRIRVVHLQENKGIAGATNVAIDNATGEYIVFLDHDDELTPDCLFEIVKCINLESPDFIYSDEDKLTPEGNFTQPHFKPDWSPDTMMSTMYTCHVSCVKTQLAREIGGLRSEFDGCQDWDFVLRVSEKTDKISHISKVLYHWRIIPASIASDITAKPYVLAASKAVREQALERRGCTGIVEELPNYHGYFRVNYKPVNDPLVSIIIPTRDNHDVLNSCVNSILNHTLYQKYEIIIVDNGSVNEKTVALLQSLNAHNKITVIRHDIPFNFSELNNYGVKNAAGDVLLFLNDDTEVVHDDWLERMVGFAQLPHVGAVGAKLLYGDRKTIQHSGVLNLRNGPSHAFLRQHKEYPGYFLRNQVEYNWLIVTGACMMIERKKFEAVSGFDESFPVAYNDVDICMSLSKAGYHNIMCQAVTLIHHESISRGVDHIDETKALRLKGELNRLNIKHSYYYQFDPYFNRNLAPNGYNFEIMK